MADAKGRLGEVAWVLAKLGIVGFGGPAAHIALMRQEMVIGRGWLTEPEFLDLLGAASVLPGPTSTQVGILLGKRRAGWAGLIVGGVCFIAPAMTIVTALAWAYVRWGTSTAGQGLLYGIKPVVIAIIGDALWGLARTAIKGRVALAAGGGAALAGYLAGANVLLVLLAVGGAVAVITNVRRNPPNLLAGIAAALPARSASGRPHPTLTAILVEFAKLGCVVFGSGYVLLAFLRRDLVGRHGWITTRQLLDAVSVGQFTPGPVFTTATFIGYLTSGVGGALVATLGIFAPSFLMMAGIAPLIPRLRAHPWPAAALDGINVAAIGLMAGVTLDLAGAGIVDAVTAVLSAATLALLVRFRPNSVWLVTAGAAIGLAHSLA
jgi:chromate transporter